MGGMVLVVDDDPNVLRAVEAMVRWAGYRAVPTDGGREAVAAYARYGAELVAAVLDVQMPGLDGPAILDALRAAGFDGPCLFLTGHAGAYTAADLRARGAAAVLAKPSSLETLSAALTVAVGGAAVGV